MLYDYFVRITYSFEEARPIITTWASKVSKMVVYQHTGEKTEKTHIHIMIIGSAITKKQLRNLAVKQGPKDWVKGQERMSFTEYDGSEMPFIYMTKGKYDPVYLQNYTKEQADEWKSKWVEPSSHIKQSSDYVLYSNAFDDDAARDLHEWMQMTRSPIGISDNDKHFNWLITYARQYVFNQNRCIWNIKAIKDYKMLVYTYIYRNGIDIPKNRLDNHGMWKDW